MKWSVVSAHWSVLFLAAVLLMPARADETKPRLDPGAAPDVQDVIFFGKNRPVMIRMHVLVDGKPFSLAWDNYVEKLFKYADRNGDGFLDGDEIKLLPPATMMQQLVRGNFYNFYNMAALPLAQLDTDSDEKVSLDELKTYYNEKAQVAALQIVSGAQFYQGGVTGNRVTAGLLKQLGAKDGKLDLNKLPKGDDLIARLDSNDDETVDAQELSSGLPQDPFIRQPGPVGGAGMMPGKTGRVSTGNSSFFLIPKERGKLTERLNLSKELIERFDKDKSGKLTREEIGLDADTFKVLDRNDDGALDSVELLRYFIVAADVEVNVHLGKRNKPDSPGIHPTPGKKGGLASSISQASNEAVMVALSNVQMELRSANGSGIYAQAPQQRRQYFDNFFTQADKGKKGFIDMKEDLKQPNVQYMKGLFEIADRDGDGKVMKKEFDDALAIQAGAFGTTTTLTVNETSKGLLEVLDTNRDGRLSVRELRAAKQKLAAFDANGDGTLSEDEIPVQISMTVSSGAQPYYANQQVYNPGAPVRPSATGGPLWFRKMDRNGDGDISRREFLGTPEEFKKLDLDGDGYLSMEEALKADALLRKK